MHHIASGAILPKGCCAIAASEVRAHSCESPEHSHHGFNQDQVPVRTRLGSARSSRSNTAAIGRPSGSLTRRELARRFTR